MRKSAAQQAQGLIFGALMAALVIIFAFTQVLAFLIPIPLVLTYMRYGGRVAVLTGFVATLFSLLFATPDVALMQVLPMGVLPGLALGLGYSRKWRPLLIGGLTVLVFCFGYLLIYLMMRFLFFAGSDPIAQVAQMMRESLTQTIQMVESIFGQLPAGDAQQQQATQAYLEQLTLLRDSVDGFVRNLLPTVLAFGGVIFAWLNMKLCALILPRFHYQVPAPTPFGNLRLPVWTTWGYFLLLFGGRVLELPMEGQPWWIEVIRNGILALQMIFGVVGLAVAYGWLIRRGLPKPIAILIGVLGFFMLNGLLLVLAAWDAIFDFRQLGHGIWRRSGTTES